MNRTEQTWVLDGDFNVQLTRHIKKAELSMYDGYLELQVLATNRSAVYETHMDFLRAGCAIIRTNTYRASVETFTEYLDLSLSESIHLIKIAAKLAQKAVWEYYQEVSGNMSSFETFNSIRPLVAGSCGSYAAAKYDEVNNCPPFWDNIPRHCLMDWHRTRIQALLDSGVDMLAFDSIPCAKEARALIELLREFPNMVAWITFFCPDGEELMDGRNFQDVAVQCCHILPRQILGIGMCCSYPTAVTLALRRFNDAYPNGDIPLIVCSDKYLLYYTDGSFECDSITGHVREWLTMGVRYISGGTDINADDIEDISNEVRKYYQNAQNAQNIPNACSFQNKRNKSKM